MEQPAIVLCVVLGLAVVWYVIRGEAEVPWKALLVLLYGFLLLSVFVLEQPVSAWRVLVLVVAVLFSLWVCDRAR